MKREFIVERQGRSFVLYAGLLDLAHSQGLKSIRTELIQVPSEANKGVAICTAIVVMEKDGIERTFTGIGDAAVNNVAPAMTTCLIRMSETRAKARALRDAVNIGVAAFEELGEADAYDGAPEAGYQAPARPMRSATPSRAATRPASPRGRAAGVQTGEMTESQESCIRRLADKIEYELPDMTGWTFGQAAELIKKLSSV